MNADDRGAAHAHSEDPQRQAAPGRRVPGVDQRDAHRERRAAQAEEEPADQQQRVRVAEQADEQHRQDRQEADGREHHPRAQPVGQGAHRDASDGPDHHRYGDEQGLLERGETELLAVGHAERADQRPRPEVDEESDRGEPEHHPRAACGGARRQRAPVRCRPWSPRSTSGRVLCWVGQLTASRVEKKRKRCSPTKVPGLRSAPPSLWTDVSQSGVRAGRRRPTEGTTALMPDVRAHRVLASISRVAVLETLRETGRPMGVRELAERMNLHDNTVRKHLDLLVENGFATRLRDGAGRRGRPRYVYAASPRSSPVDVRLRNYRLLASVFAAYLDDADDPQAAAEEAGRRFGVRSATRGATRRPGPHDRAAACRADARRHRVPARAGRRRRRDPAAPLPVPRARP